MTTLDTPARTAAHWGRGNTMPINAKPPDLDTPVQPSAFAEWCVIPCSGCPALVTVVSATQPVVCPNPYCRRVIRLSLVPRA